MLKSIMEDQNSNTPPPAAPNTNPQVVPPVVVSQPTQPVAPTAPATPVTPAAPPQVSVVTSSPSTGQPNAATPNVAPTGPLTEWPGAFKIYKISKAAIMLNVGAMIGLVAIEIGLVILYLILLIVTRHSINRIFIELPYDLVTFLFSGAVVYATIQGAKGNKITIGQAFSVALKKWVNLILASVLLGITVGASIVLLIIPFFFVFPRLLLTTYYVIDQDMGPVQALQASWDQTKGNVSKIYGIIGVGILIVLPVITIIGILLTWYLGFMYYAAFAILYLYIRGKQSGVAPSATIAQPPITPGVAPTPAAS